MPHFLRTIRFDAPDTHVFERAAEPVEWAVSGGFAFCELEPEEITGKHRQAFANGFLSLESFGRASLVSVAEIGESEMQGLVESLAMHFVTMYGAPDMAAALPVACGEIAFAGDLAQGQPVGILLAVARARRDRRYSREIPIGDATRRQGRRACADLGCGGRRRCLISGNRRTHI
ncbi:DUF6505 family protein [Breoghania sp.]|uniref:DUF6505 family protein n=1 Tax=Breoghania sp. TaxID=2065378 RepID=UPI0026174823|nr:DUF6505 family protein [Breoghania sp.]MDJ0931414.1 DUF6505 family protein [Breoghania sp.]